MAAAYLDRGLEAARAVARYIASAELARTGDARDSKSLLQEKAQANGSAAPTYRLVSEEGPAHARCFVVRVEVDGRDLGEGRGRSKKLAEQEAAQKALESLSPAAARG